MQVFAKAHSEHEEAGNIELATLSPQERFNMVATRVGLFIILAVGAVFIPVLHFILVPAFLIFAVLAGLSASRYTQKVTSGSVPCPHCKQEVIVKPTPLNWPLTCVCQNCASSVRLYQNSQVR